MSQDTIINPFKQTKKTDWSQKAKERLDQNSLKTNNNITKTENSGQPSKLVNSKNKINRVAKSFKVYPGKIIKDFDKRVNKMQVKFDDLDFEKDYVDSGKYIMFLMSLSEKIGLHELYTQVNQNGDFDLNKDKLKKILN